MKRLDKELPGLRHGLEREPAQRIGVHRDAPPPKYSQPLNICSGFYGGASFRRRARWEECKAEPEDFRQRNALLLCPRAKESVRYRSEQSSPIAARAVCVHPAAVRQPLQRR